MNFLTEISGPPLVEIPAERWIFEQIERWAKRFPDRFAFAMDQAGGVEEYRYADVLKQAAQVAAGLAAQGIQQGDRIGILMENIPQWVFALLGAMRLGAITVPLATALPQDSLRRVAEHSGCRLVFTDASNLEKAQELRRVLEHSGGRVELPAKESFRGTSSSIRRRPRRRNLDGVPTTLS